MSATVGGSIPRIDKVAVLGAGVMGGTIAAHLFNAGLKVLLLDIVPKAPTPEEAAAGLTLKDAAVRNRIPAAGLAALEKLKPSPIFLAADLARIEVGNLEDDLGRAARVRLGHRGGDREHGHQEGPPREKIAPHLKPGAILSTNTSGLSVNELAEALPEALRPRFLVTHFFNPPRYMKLLEIVSSRFTDPGVAEGMAELHPAPARQGDRLRQGHAQLRRQPDRRLRHLQRGPAHAGARAGRSRRSTRSPGPATARPKSACFRTADLVGIDTLAARGEELLRPAARRTSSATSSSCPTSWRRWCEGAARQQVASRASSRRPRARSRDLLLRLREGGVRPRRAGPSSPRWRRPRGSTTRPARLRAVLGGSDKGGRAGLAQPARHAHLRLQPHPRDRRRRGQRRQRHALGLQLGARAVRDARRHRRGRVRQAGRGRRGGGAGRAQEGGEVLRLRGRPEAPLRRAGRRLEGRAGAGRAARPRRCWRRPARWWSGTPAPRSTTSATASSASSSTPR